jgi:hypothetical protein
MNFGRDQPHSQPIVRVARVEDPELVLLPSSRSSSGFVVSLIDTAAHAAVGGDCRSAMRTRFPANICRGTATSAIWSAIWNVT